MANGNLAALVGGLPTELFDEIYNLTFTASSTSPRTISNTYQPPQLLQVSHATRELFAKSYYGQGPIFYIPKDLLKSFLRSLPKPHAAHITEIRVVEERSRSDIKRGEGYALSALNRLTNIETMIGVYSINPRVGRNVVKVEVPRPDGEMKWLGVEQLGGGMYFGR